MTNPTSKRDEQVREIIKNIIEKSQTDWKDDNEELCPHCVEKVINETLIQLNALYEVEETGVLQADEVTLGFFRKYLEMPEGNLEDMCREIIRLKCAQQGLVGEKITAMDIEAEITAAYKSYEKSGDLRKCFQDLGESIYSQITAKGDGK